MENNVNSTQTALAIEKAHEVEKYMVEYRKFSKFVFTGKFTERELSELRPNPASPYYMDSVRFIRVNGEFIEQWKKGVHSYQTLATIIEFEIERIPCTHYDNR
jgi:hypothetical protein